MLKRAAGACVRVCEEGAEGAATVNPMLHLPADHQCTRRRVAESRRVIGGILFPFGAAAADKQSADAVDGCGWESSFLDEIAEVLSEYWPHAAFTPPTRLFIFPD